MFRSTDFGSRDESEMCSDLSEFSWAEIASSDGDDEEEEGVDDVEGDEGGDVCVPIVRLKRGAISSVVSESASSSPPAPSPCPECLAPPSGNTETVFSNLSLRVSRLVCAIPRNSCRAEVSDSSNGLTMYFEVP